MGSWALDANSMRSKTTETRAAHFEVHKYHKNNLRIQHTLPIKAGRFPLTLRVKSGTHNHLLKAGVFKATPADDEAGSWK